LQRIAKAEAAAIAQQFNMSSTPSTPENPSQSPGRCQFVYTVQPGESLYSIAQLYGTSWQTLASYNNIQYPYGVVTGQTIRIPGSGAVADYTVSGGDNLYTIGQRFGIPWQAIAIANNVEPPYQLYIGDHLIIPTTCYLYYNVRQGDSLYRIGEKFGVSWEALAEINQISYPYQLNPGTNLMIPLPLQ
jgi:LysM repeat protein